MRIIFLRKEYLSLLPSMIASLFSANGVAAAIDLCQGYDIKASCHASRQSLSGITQDWSIADGQWLVFSDMTNNASGGAVFLQQGAEFTLSPENETGMTLFANNTVTGEYNNGGAIFAKENSTLNLTDVIFSGNVAGGYGGAIYSSGTNDTGAVDLRVTNAMFRNNIANDGKGGAIYTINNDVYLSDVIFDNNQAYTSTSYSDGDGGAIDVTDNNSDSKHPSGYTIINNTAFTNNTAEGYGGAIYTNSATAPYLIDISVDDSYSQNGGVLVDENNSAAGYGDGPSTAAGGFMYLGLSEVTFDIADGKTLVIGNTENDGAVDSIAGTGLITKTGSGDLVLNADNNDFTGEMQIENGEVTLGRSNSLMNVGDTHCQDDPQDCYGLTIGSIDKYQNQAELNVGSTQQTFVHSLTGFQNGTLNIDAGGNVTVNQGSFAGTIEGAGQLTIAQNGSYVLSGAGTLELTASGTTQSAVRVEEGTLKGDVADIFPYASSLWVGDGATFVTGADQDIQSIDATSSGTIDISDGTVLRLTGQDTSVALNASLFNGDGTLVNATDGVTLTGELNTNLETDSLTYLADVTVNGDLTNTSGAVSLQNGVAGDTLTVNGDYTGGGTLLFDSELNGDDSVSDQLVMNGNTAGNTTVVVNSITGIGEPTSTGIKVVDFAADPTQFQNNAQFSLAGSGYVNMGAYDYTLVEDNNDWYLRSQEVTPPSPPDPDPDPTPDPIPAYQPVLNAKVGGYLNNLRAANQAFMMERRDHAGGNGQTLNLRVIGGRYHYTAAGQLAQHEDTSTVQLSGDLFSGRWGDDDGEWMLGAVGGYSDNQGESRSNMTGTRADNQNHGYAVGLTSSWYQHGNQKQGAWLDSWLQYAWFNNDVSEQDDGTDHYHSSGIIASLEAGYQWLPGRGVVIEPQAQVIYQGVQQDDFTAANHARVSQSQGDDIQTRLGLHSEWRTAVGVTPTLDLNYYHDPHATEIEEDGRTISDDAVKRRGEIKVGVTGNISQRVSLRGSVAWQKGSDDFAQTAGFLSMTVKW
ncbi:autotransporter outer membrane beta-barrel domain-containing protein [Escherichia coli]|nr:autotransporter outer membrane beta-barrel domain-containing protein [Escherichia coli]